MTEHEKTWDDARRALLSVEHFVRRLESSTRSQYAGLHYKEIEACTKLMLVQLEYARLAEEGSRP